VGVKGAWFDNRLNASLAVFRIEQDNVGQATSEPIIGRPGEFAYRRTRHRQPWLRVRSERRTGTGLECDLRRFALRGQGHQRRRHQHQPAADRAEAVHQLHPAVAAGTDRRRRCQLAEPHLLRGAGSGRFEQEGYALVSAFVRYRISPEFSVQANLNNLLDKKYYSQITGYGATAMAAMAR
jgi:outer membrane receptor for ferric coprogen and ferric-rhodotorulic acid